MKNQELDLAIDREAAAFGLEPRLVSAIVQVESGGDPYAWNPEGRYRYLWDCREGKPFRRLSIEELESKWPPHDFRPPKGLASARDAEWWGQQASWGLMQVMGAVARELGYAGHLPGLCNLHVGLRYGCMHLAGLERRFRRKQGPEAVIAAYNAGSPRKSTDTGQFVNQSYVDKVKRRMGS